MTDDNITTPPAAPPAAGHGGTSKEEVALELMRFIAMTTGFGKASTGAGFAGKSPKTADEQVEALLQLYDRCRVVVSKPAGEK